MNQPIARLFVIVLVMFGLLVGFTSRWTVFDASALRANPLNKLPGLEDQTVPRGQILARDGVTVLARSRRRSDGLYRRSYPFGPLFAHPIGYYSPYNGSSEIERYHAGQLAGAPPQQSSIIDQLEGRQTSGDEVVSTLDAHAQQVAYAGLAGRTGAVVAIVPSTGAIRVLASSPSYNPNDVNNTAAFNRLLRDPAQPLFDNATQAQYAPGSTFKVVTTIAALDTGRLTPNSVINGNSPITVSGQPLSNDGGTSYGPVTLRYALTNSINTVYAQAALKVGAATLQRYMQRLGFYATPPIDLPADEVVASGVRYAGHAGYLPLTAGADVGRVGIGEGGLEATPLQMAMVAAAVANGGRLMVPHLTSEVLNADGQVVTRVAPRLEDVVMTPATAHAVGLMMENVVNDGTGTAAALAGITVAGKTGTAQDCADLALAACRLNQVWFIAYAPVDHPQIAVAVTLPHQNGFGGQIAAPIARAVLQALLGEPRVTLSVAAGTLIDGRYRVVSRVGSGGMAEVYCAEDTQLGRRVAVKLLHERFAADEEFVERFRREASSAAALSHANIVSVYDRGEWSGTYYIAMEYLDGRSLDSIVREEAPLAPERAIEITEQVLRAARFAHRRGIVHRDLKPHNVILDEEGRVKVTDFGIARAGASEITQTGSIMGTARYLSPEQAQGNPVSPRSDLYSIGVMLYELLTGAVPFEGDSVVAIALRHLSEPPRPPSSLVPSISPALDAIVLRALAKNPDQRFGDADEFIAALDNERARIRGDSGAQTAALGPVIVTPPPSPYPATYATQALAPITGAYGRAGAGWWEPVDTGAFVPGVPAPPGPPPLLGPGERGRGPVWPWILIGALVAAAAAVAIVLLLGKSHSPPPPPPTPTPTVPNVVGQRKVVADAHLSQAGYVPLPQLVPSHRALGRVVSTNPAAGKALSKGSTVLVNVSSGPKVTFVQVPDVVGQRAHAAVHQLRAAGFKVSSTPQASTGVAKGVVISTNPPPASSLTKGSAVAVFYSSGPPPVAVPGVVGETLSQARAVLEARGFKIGLRQQNTASPAPGTVVGQSPSSGKAPQGSTVTLTVAHALPNVTVPYLIGLTQVQADQALAKANLVPIPIVVIKHHNPGNDGLVIQQTPTAGAPVPPQTNVTIRVEQYEAPLGPTGPTGPSGTSGPGGSSGTSGPGGSSGPSGSSGASGTTGSSGASGATG